MNPKKMLIWGVVIVVILVVGRWAWMKYGNAGAAPTAPTA
jgi:hypothetical protein